MFGGVIKAPEGKNGNKWFSWALISVSIGDKVETRDNKIKKPVKARVQTFFVNEMQNQLWGKLSCQPGFSWKADDIVNFSRYQTERRWLRGDTWVET
jgi:hypothetical protein